MNLQISLPTPSQLWRLLPGLLLLLLLLVLFHETAVAMVSIWIRSETFAHAFLVPLITAWLIWRRRANLAQHAPQPNPWLLLPMALVCLMWLMGALAEVGAATQFALVLLITLTVPTVFGLGVAREIIFPLVFLLFSVPFGEFMVPPMMEWTATFTVFALQMTGVPVYREGLQFVIPSGNWSVVEACSGVRYLMASFMVGSLFAYLNYRSSKRRALFMLVSLVMPIIANWLRAYLIVLLGHFSGNKLAAGADHLVYGWVFFGFIIMVMFMIGARWSEPESAVPAVSAKAAADLSLRVLDSRTWLVVGGATAMLIGTQLIMAHLNRPSEGAPISLELPNTLPFGWLAEKVDAEAWSPKYLNPNAVSHLAYVKGNRNVAVWVAYFRNQGPERKMVSSSNLLVEEKSQVWAVVAQGQARLAADSLSPGVSTAVLRQPANPKLEPKARLEVAYMYWVNGRFTHRASEAKLLLALGRLMGKDDDGAVLVFATKQAVASGDSGGLHEFVVKQLPSLRAWLDSVSAASRP